MNEKWKDRRTLKLVYKKYKNPLILSSKEIALRMDDIGRRKRLRYYLKEVFDIQSEYFDPQNHHGKYFSEYRLLSTLYRLCAFLGWLELLRIEVTFLESGKNKQDTQIRSKIRSIQSALSDLQLNENKLSTDVVIFREEQRAIGEGMIDILEGKGSIIGYGTFVEKYKGFLNTGENPWLKPVISYFKEIQAENDFRIKRAEILRDEILDFIFILDETEGNSIKNIIQNAA